MPPEAAALKEAIASADGVLLVTPEYNNGIPGVFKNAIDWGTRPYGQNSWARMPAAITGTSPGAVGTAVAQSRLRSDMLNAGCMVMAIPEAYIQWKPEIYAPDGSVEDEGTRKFLQGFVDAFVSWIDTRG